MRLIFIIILLAFASCIFVACQGKPSEKTKVQEDSLKNIETAIQKEIARTRNTYLIEPPDTSYTGEYLDKYENGNTKFKGFFRFGKRHGQWMAWYANGGLWSECYYDKGLRSGANNVYYENGKIRYQGWYKNDMRDSVWLFYDAFGSLKKKIAFKNDEEVATPN